MRTGSMRIAVLGSICLVLAGSLMAHAQLDESAPPQTGTVVQPGPPPSAARSGGSFSQDTSAIASAVDDRKTTRTPTIKVTSRLVTVDVIVTDKNGTPVRGLTRDDFSILEGGQPQPIRAFEVNSGGGLVVPAAAVAGSDKISNAGQEAHTPALHAILFDALNTSPADQSFARTQIRKLVKSLPPGSRVALFVLRNDLHLVQGFTTETALLEKALAADRSQPGPWFNDPEAVLFSGTSGAGASIAEQQSGNAIAGSTGLKSSYLEQNAARDQATLNGSLRIEKTLRALSQISSYLAALPGRKNLLWVAGTFPVELLPDTAGSGGDLFRDTQSYSAQLAALALRMQQGDVAIYPVDATGLAPNPLFGGANASVPSANDLANVAGANLQKFQVMDDIAYQTGGHAIYEDNDLQGAMTEILNQGSEYYSLAYSPSDHNWNGKYRKIVVRVPGKQVKLYYRRGYLAVDGEKLAETAPPAGKFTTAMLRGAPERAEVVMTVAATPDGSNRTAEQNVPQTESREKAGAHTEKFTGPSAGYKIECAIDPKTIQFTTVNGDQRATRLALTFLAYDADGKVLNSYTSLFGPSLPLRQYEAVLSKGLTLTGVMQLPPGRVFLRVGVHDLLGDKVGSVEIPLLVARVKS